MYNNSIVQHCNDSAEDLKMNSALKTSSVKNNSIELCSDGPSRRDEAGKKSRFYPGREAQQKAKAESRVAELKKKELENPLFVFNPDAKPFVPKNVNYIDPKKKLEDEECILFGSSIIKLDENKLFELEQEQLRREAEKQQQLLMKTITNTIPRYDPTTNLNDLVRQLRFHFDEVKPEYFEYKGYPDFVTKNIISAFNNKDFRPMKARSVPSMYRHEVHHNRNNVRGTFNRNAAIGSLVTIWKVPCVNHGGLQPKPFPFNMQKFKAWCESTAFELKKTFKFKTMYVTGNDAAKFLYYSAGSYLPPHKINDYLVKAELYVGNYHEIDYKPISNLRLFDFVDSEKPLYYKGTELTQANYKNVAVDFVKNKPIWNVIVSHFSGHKVDLFKLQHSLDELSQQFQSETKVLTTVENSSQQVENSSIPSKDVIELQCFRTKHEVKFDFDFGLSGISKLANAISYDEASDSDAFRIIVNLITTITGVYYASNWQSLAVQLIQFCNNIQFLRRYLYSRIKKLAQMDWNIFKVGVFVQDDEDDPFIKSGLFDFTIVSVVGALISGLHSSVQDVIGPVLWEVVMQVKSNIQISAVKSMAEKIIEYVFKIIENIKLCVQSRSLTPLLSFNKYNISSYVKFGNNIVAYQDLITASDCGNPDIIDKLKTLREKQELPSYVIPCSNSTYLNWLDDFIVEGEEIVDFYKKAKLNLLSVNQILEKLRQTKSQLITRSALGSERVVPFAVMLEGAPGTGKTYFNQDLIKTIALRNNYDPTPNGVYAYLPSSANFDDGLTNSHWCGYMDDKDLGVAPSVASCPTYCDKVIGICNSAPCQVEQANLNKKGTTYVNFTLFTFCTNLGMSRAKTLLLEPGAFGRRFNYKLKFSVKDEFRIPGTDRFDATKYDSSLMNDYFLIDIYKFGKDDFTIKLNTLPVNYDTAMRFLCQKYELHLSEQLKALRSRTIGGHRCNICLLTSCAGNCSSDIVVLQNGEDSLFRARFLNVPSKLMSEFSLVIQFWYLYFIYVFLLPRLYNWKDLTLCQRAICWTLKNDNQNIYVGLFEQMVYGPGAVDLPQGFNGPVIRHDFDWETTREGIRTHFVLPLDADKFNLRGRVEYAPIVQHQDLVAINNWIDESRTILENPKVIASMVALLGAGLLIARFVKQRIQLQARENNTVNGLVSATWTRPDISYNTVLPPSVFTAVTWSKEELINIVKRNTIPLICIRGDKEVRSHGVAYDATHLIVTTHSVQIGDNLSFTYQGAKFTKIITQEMVTNFTGNTQLSLLYVNTLQGCNGVKKFIQAMDDISLSTLDEVHIVFPDEFKLTQSNSFKNFSGTKVLSVSPSITIAGDCGVAYIGRHGSSWRIYAIHYCITNGASVGEVITQVGIDALIKVNKIMLQQNEVYVQTFAKNANPELEPLDASRSHVSAVTAFIPKAQPPIYGYLKGNAGSTMKTKCYRSIFWEDLREFEKEWCGKEPYWLVPNFKGFMQDEAFKSPWTNAFETWNNKQLDHKTMCVAFCDFINGIQYLDFQGYGILSEEQIFVGVPGTINSMNFKTSAGPPWNRAKGNYMYRDGEDVFVSPEIWEMYDKLEETLKQGRCPITMAMCVLKDEPIKPGKFPRVFCCLSVALNMLMKKYNSCWKLLMRNNPGFFESFVGIDLTSTGGNVVIKQLQRVLGDKFNEAVYYDGDVSAMDKSFSADLYDWAARLIYIMTKNVGGCEDISKNLILSLKNTLYNIKGDIISAYWNPSGNDCTVELNGLVMSLCVRYAYYKMFPFQGDVNKCVEFVANLQDERFHTIEGFTFRENVSLITYGDDNLIATLLPFDGEKYLSVWSNEIGMVMKPADKLSTTFKPKNLGEIDFCQRKFVFDPELNAYKGQLGKSRIARTLLIKKPSILSNTDHAATVLSDTQREMFYYGREEFAKFQNEIVIPLATKYQLLTNPYFKLGSYDEWLCLYKEGKFRTWNDNFNITLPNLLEEEFETQSNSMSKINLANSSNVEETSAANSFEVGSVPIKHEVGEIMTSSNLVKDSLGGFTNTTTQLVPNNPIDKFLSRPVEIRSYELSTLDAPLAISHSFYPWELFLSNAAVLDKTFNFQYIKGTIQLTAVVTASGGSFGFYTLSALPNGGYANTISPDIHIENCLQVEHCAAIDIAGSPNVVLQLPFVYFYDYATITDLQFRQSWEVFLICMQQVKNAVPGGVAKAHIKIYAHLLPDYELVVPTYQAKMKTSSIFGKVGSALNSLGDVPMIGSYAGVAGKAASAASSALEYFGFSRENAQSNPTNFVTKSVTNVANVDVDDNNDVAALFPDNKISIDSRLGGGSDKDILSFGEFFNHWTLGEAFPWASTDATGAVLGTIPVSPLWAPYGDTAPVVSYHFSPAGYVGIHFEYWRGSMEYKIIIPVSKFHRGSLQLVWSPRQITAPATVLTNIALNTIYDVATDVDKVFRVGYARNEPFLRCAIQNLEFGTNYTEANGEILIKVVNPLVAQSETETLVYVFHRACSDMTFAKLRDLVNTPATIGGAITSRVLRTSCYLQGGALGDDELTEETVELVPLPQPIPFKDLYFGEEIGSLRALMQKPSQLGKIAFDANSNPTNRLTYTDYDMLRLNDGGVRASLDLANYLASPFVGIAASERYKVFPNEDVALGAARIDPFLGSATPNISAPSTLAPMTFCGPNKGGEFSIPYYTPRKFVSVTRNNNAGLGYNRVYGYVLESTSLTCSCSIYHSYGSDIRVTQFSQIPLVLIGDPVSGQGQFYWY